MRAKIQTEPAKVLMVEVYNETLLAAFLPQRWRYPLDKLKVLMLFIKCSKARRPRERKRSLVNAGFYLVHNDTLGLMYGMIESRQLHRHRHCIFSLEMSYSSSLMTWWLVNCMEDSESYFEIQPLCSENCFFSSIKQKLTKNVKIQSLKIILGGKKSEFWGWKVIKMRILRKEVSILRKNR